MPVEKSEILKSLKALHYFDPKGAPYIGVQLSDETPKFYRSSSNGFIQSQGFTHKNITFVSLPNFIDCLKNIPENLIQLGLDTNGILHIIGTSDDSFESESHVHTVLEGQAGIKKHDIGELRIKIDKESFSKIDVRPFKIVTPPVLVRGRLMLVTDAGATVVWDGPESLLGIPEIYPRDNFIRMVSRGSNVKEIMINSNGYWGAIIDDMVTYTKGHIIGKQIFDNYTVPGQEIAKLPAQRLVVGLDAAVGLLEPSERLDIDPKLGILAKGKFGDNRNSIGETGNWEKFGLLARTAKVVSDALSQTIEDEVSLSQITTSIGPLLRFKRGPFEITFKAYYSH